MRMTKEQFHEVAPNRTERKCVEHHLIKTNDTTFVVKDKVNLIVYLLVVIPAIIITLLAVLWDGGLKTFEFPTRTVRTDYIHKEDNPEFFEKFVKIYHERG